MNGSGILVPPMASTSNLSSSGNGSTNAQDDAFERPFRSRKMRPCDSCRRAKNRCAIPIQGQPCTECKQTNKACTFDAPPPARPNRPSALKSLSGSEHESASPPHPQSQPKETPKATSSSTLKRPRPSSPAQPPLPASDLRAESRSQSRSRTRHKTEPEPGLTSLDLMCPPTHEISSITALLTDDLLPVRGRSDPSSSEVEAVGHKQVSGDTRNPFFLVFTAVPANRRFTEDTEKTLLRRLRSTLSILPSGTFSEHLALDVYRNQFHPCLPIVPDNCLTSIDALPTSLATTLLATSLILSPSSQPSSEPVWSFLKETKIGDVALETARLSSISTALLELFARPGLDTRGDFMLLAKTIAQAQLLGLHIDCADWTIPAWEKEYRTRLWGAITMLDTWTAFLNSRPSHLQTGNSTVPIPPRDNGPPTTFSTFHYQCRLAAQIARVQTELCTSRKGKPLRDGKPALVLDAVKHELQDLTSETLAMRNMAVKPVGGDCFLLQLLGYKCMNRRIQIELKAGIGGPFTPDFDTLSLFSEFIEFIDNLSDESLNGFWLPFSRHILSSAMSSLIRFSLASVSSAPSNQLPALEPMRLLERLCIVLHQIDERVHWEVGRWALSRAATVADRLRNVANANGGMADEYCSIVLALERSLSTVVESAMQITPPFGVDANKSFNATSNPTSAMDSTLTPVFNEDGALPDLDHWLAMLSDAGFGAETVGLADLGGAGSEWQWDAGADTQNW